MRRARSLDGMSAWAIEERGGVEEDGDEQLVDDWDGIWWAPRPTLPHYMVDEEGEGRRVIEGLEGVGMQAVAQPCALEGVEVVMGCEGRERAVLEDFVRGRGVLLRAEAEEGELLLRWTHSRGRLLCAAVAHHCLLQSWCRTRHGLVGVCDVQRSHLTAWEGVSRMEAVHRGVLRVVFDEASSRLVVHRDETKGRRDLWKALASARRRAAAKPRGTPSRVSTAHVPKAYRSLWKKCLDGRTLITSQEEAGRAMVEKGRRSLGRHVKAMQRRVVSETARLVASLLVRRPLHLPPEVLRTIFEWLPHKPAGVCRAWSRVARDMHSNAAKVLRLALRRPVMLDRVPAAVLSFRRQVLIVQRWWRTTTLARLELITRHLASPLLPQKGSVASRAAVYLTALTGLNHTTARLRRVYHLQLQEYCDRMEALALARRILFPDASTPPAFEPPPAPRPYRKLLPPHLAATVLSLPHSVLMAGNDEHMPLVQEHSRALRRKPISPLENGSDRAHVDPQGGLLPGSADPTPPSMEITPMSQSLAATSSSSSSSS
eukprot:Sspe_Gene.25690::Locus_10381_Transcript_2_2_Confidence_0.500_Length_1750::g.25690::m.25690